MVASDRRVVVVSFNVSVACVVSAEGSQARWENASVWREAWVAVLQRMSDE